MLKAQNKNGELIYLIAFAIFTAVYFIFKTTFVEGVDLELGTKVIKSLIITLIFVKFIVFDRYKSYEYLILLGLVGCVFLVTYKSTNMDLFNFCLMLIGARGVSFLKINQVFVYISLPLMLITIFCSQIDLINDLIYSGLRGDAYIDRHSFGIYYPTNFAASCFFILLSLVYISFNNRFAFFKSIVLALIAILIMYFCDARLDSICILLLIPILFLYKAKRFILKSMILRWLLILFPLFCLLFSIFSAYYFSYDIPILNELNKALSGRLDLGHIGINDYGFSLFGQVLEENGLGGETDKVFNAENPYFYIDSSFLKILLRYGDVITILLVLFLTLFNFKQLKNGNLMVVMLLCLVCLNGVIAHHLIDLLFTPFLLALNSLIKKENYETRKKLPL